MTLPGSAVLLQSPQKPDVLGDRRTERDMALQQRETLGRWERRRHRSALFSAPPDEMVALQSVFASCQDLLAKPSATIGELLAGVGNAVGADEIFLLVDGGAELKVSAHPRASVGRIDHDRAGELSPDAFGGLDAGATARLAAAVGAHSPTVAGFFGRTDPNHEILLVGWLDGPAFSPMATGVLANAVCTAVAALRQRREAVSEMMGKTRARLAYALHDDLTQTVTGAVLELEGLRSRIEEDPSAAVAQIDRSKVEIRRGLSDLRRILFDLQRTSSEEEGQAQPSSPLPRYVDDVVKRWRLPARVEAAGDLSRVPARVMSVAYAVLREALTNAAKHASGRNVNVRLAASGSALTVKVSDAGLGFSRGDEEAARKERHFGLQMLRRRVREIGGTLSIHSTPGTGTTLVAMLPTMGGEA
jgi:signal transduction histidine kinase